MTQNGQTSNEGPVSHWRPPPPGPPPTWRQIPKVPELLLKEEQNSQDYIPEVVSIGPYHHGKPELRLAESFKPMALEMVLSGDKEKEDYYYAMIRDEIFYIRSCYEEHPTHLYSDDELARMVLLDACFIIICIESWLPPLRQSDGAMLGQNEFLMFQTLGKFTVSITYRDMILLENQIPLRIVKLLLGSRYSEDESQELLTRYFSMIVSGDYRQIRTLPLENEEDLHLLEASHRFLTFDCVRQPKKTCLSFINCKFFSCFRTKEKTVDPRTTDSESAESHQGTSRFQSCLNELKARACKRLIEKDNKGDYTKVDAKTLFHCFRSVTDLKAKGIHFEPSPTPSLQDVQFESNCIYGKLQLPIHFVSINTKVFFLNMIAYEFNPNNPRDDVVTSYIDLMKSLIVRPEDVKELREKRILLCQGGSDEQVLKMYLDINTYWPTEVFQDVKDRIQVHYNSKSKTWIAEFIHTYFRSPWTVIALLAATCLLVLTVLQTIYAMKS